MMAEGGRESGREFTAPGEERKERRQMREVTLTPTPARAGMLQSPALAPPLPAKERTVRDGEGSSPREDGLSRDGGGKENEKIHQNDTS